MSEQPALRPRYICIECEVLYGPLDVKRPRYGYCPGCWAVWLAVCAQNARRLFVSDAMAKGETPIWLPFVRPQPKDERPASDGQERTGE